MYTTFVDIYYLQHIRVEDPFTTLLFHDMISNPL